MGSIWKAIGLGGGLLVSAWAYGQQAEAAAKAVRGAVPELESDTQEYDSAKGTLKASGNVELTHAGAFLQCDTLTVDQNSGTATAEGNVRITRRDARILAEKATYRYTDASFSAENFRMGVYPVYLSGERAEGTFDDIRLSETTLFYLEPDAFSPNVHAETTTLTDQEQLEFGEATFRIGETPVLSLPTYSQNIAETQPVEFDSGVGYRSDLGVYTHNKALVRLKPEFKPGINLDGYSERGVLAGPVIDYQWIPESKSLDLDGYLDTGFIHDFGQEDDLGFDRLGNPVLRKRYFIEWSQRAQLGKSVDTVAVLNVLSDSEVQRDFRPDMFDQDPYPDNYAEAVYRGENWLAGVFTRFQPNDYEQTRRRLPEIQFAQAPARIGKTFLQHEVSGSYANLEERDSLGLNTTRNTHRLNGYSAVTAPLQNGDRATLKPVAGAMLTQYERVHPGEDSEHTRVVAETGFDAELNLNANWDVHNTFWGIDGLRHNLRPVAQYRFIPGSGTNLNDIPALDRRPVFSTSLDPLGLASRRSIEDISDQNTFRVGTQNLIQTRRDEEEYGSRDLATLDVFQDVHLRKVEQRTPVLGEPHRKPEGDLGDVYTTATLAPAYWLEQKLFTRVDPESGSLNQISTRTRLLEREDWSVFVGNDYITDIVAGPVVQQYVVGGDYSLTSRMMAGVEYRIDAERSELTEQLYKWKTRLGKAWNVEFQLQFLEGNSREGSFGFSVNVELLGL